MFYIKGKHLYMLNIERKLSCLLRTVNTTGFINHSIYIVKDGITYPVTGKKEFFIPLNDKKRQIKNFIKTNKLKILKKVPESFVPVLEFYDNMDQ